MAVHVHKYNSNEFWALERVFPHIICSMFWKSTPNHIHTSHVISAQLRKMIKLDPLTKSSCGFTRCCRGKHNYWACSEWTGSLAHHMEALGRLDNPANHQHLDTLRLKCMPTQHMTPSNWCSLSVWNSWNRTCPHDSRFSIRCCICIIYSFRLLRVIKFEFVSRLAILRREYDPRLNIIGIMNETIIDHLGILQVHDKILGHFIYKWRCFRLHTDWSRDSILKPGVTIQWITYILWNTIFG